MYKYKLSYIVPLEDYNGIKSSTQYIGYFKNYNDIAKHLGVSYRSIMYFASGSTTYIRGTRIKSIDIIKIK